MIKEILTCTFLLNSSIVSAFLYNILSFLILFFMNNTFHILCEFYVFVRKGTYVFRIFVKQKDEIKIYLKTHLYTELIILWPKPI